MHNKLYTDFPDFIYEALITQVDYRSGTCTISPLSPSLEDLISEVPLPNHLGTGNSGIFHGLEIGSRVLVVNTSGNGREYSVIVGTLPKEGLYSSEFRAGNKPTNSPMRAIPYPELASGRMIVRGGAGNGLYLMEDGTMDLSTIAQKGIFFRRHRLQLINYVVAEKQISYSNSGKSVSGDVHRISEIKQQMIPKKDIGEAPIGSDIEYHKRSNEIGFFSGSKVSQRTFGGKIRNPAIAENRTVVNEFAVESRFAGFDKEHKRSANFGAVMEPLISNKYQNLGNILNLAPDELVEIIAGNVVTTSAKIMDLNYNNLSYGNPENRVPRSITEKSMEAARRISRRGIGYHFQLSTASTTKEKNTSKDNLVFDIDKEGVLKLNIPRSSNTGNFPYASIADFSSNTPSVEFAQPSEEEPVPVMLRNEFGESILPSIDPSGASLQNRPTRFSGIRFSNTDSNPYFKSNATEANIVRINPTKYHNMYAAAERLIACTIDLVNIPEKFTDENDRVIEVATNKPFEILYPAEYFSESEEEKESVLPLYMSTVVVVPGSPAIYTGGDTIVSGVYYEKSSPMSNSFKLNSSATGFSVENADESGNKFKPIGGVSAHLNFEGAVYSSIGADNVDRKSMLLDTDGSIISWIGKDNAGRSLITQTDGDVLVNIGGSYSGRGSEPSDKSINIGRFELRVNVTDKLFVSSETNEEADPGEDGSNPLGNSDIIISLSENGIVIAGMKAGLPMIIRNNDKIMIESTGSDVILKGTDVKMIDASGQIKTLKSEGK